jgi:hypothetical protein
LPLAGQAAAQGLPVAAPQEIVAGTRSCAAATTAVGVDVQKLEADGWRRATVAADGKTVETLAVYGKGKLLLTLIKGGAKSCVVMARIQDAATFGDVAFEMDKGLGAAGAARPGEANTIYWFMPGNIVQMAMTGKPDAPSVRVAVGYYGGEKK